MYVIHQKSFHCQITLFSSLFNKKNVDIVKRDIPFQFADVPPSVLQTTGNIAADLETVLEQFGSDMSEIMSANQIAGKHATYVGPNKSQISKSSIYHFFVNDH